MVVARRSCANRAAKGPEAVPGTTTGGIMGPTQALQIRVASTARPTSLWCAVGRFRPMRPLWSVYALFAALLAGCAGGPPADGPVAEDAGVAQDTRVGATI